MPHLSTGNSGVLSFSAHPPSLQPSISHPLLSFPSLPTPSALNRHFPGLAGKLCRADVSAPGGEGSADDPLDLRHFGPEVRRLRGAGLVVTTVPTGVSAKRTVGSRAGPHVRQMFRGMLRLQALQQEILRAPLSDAQELRELLVSCPCPPGVGRGAGSSLRVLLLGMVRLVMSF